MFFRPGVNKRRVEMMSLVFPSPTQSSVQYIMDSKCLTQTPPPPLTLFSGLSQQPCRLLPLGGKWCQWFTSRRGGGEAAGGCADPAHVMSQTWTRDCWLIFLCCTMTALHLLLSEPSVCVVCHRFAKASEFPEWNSLLLHLCEAFAMLDGGFCGRVLVWIPSFVLATHFTVTTSGTDGYVRTSICHSTTLLWLYFLTNIQNINWKHIQRHRCQDEGEKMFYIW